ncbi:Peptidyl-prolyl cis-trans isomerase-like 4 [Smittium culicis]|uniref:Peptidyl-prolyl cis-trans isomerase-like 4 n=2 Tax=Smittium culicis TaxID=133412 RepID=A0A1R1Y9X8_9FUNG|nr:Peptidyl-prolyl cis-trans isomerase-like 4 [Smittium culicis]
MINRIAFVEFEDPLDAEDAYNEMHGSSIDGHRITIQWARSPPSRTWRIEPVLRGSDRRNGAQSYRRDRSYSYSRSRSRSPSFDRYRHRDDSRGPPRSPIRGPPYDRSPIRGHPDSHRGPIRGPDDRSPPHRPPPHLLRSPPRGYSHGRGFSRSRSRSRSFSRGRPYPHSEGPMGNNGPRRRRYSPSFSRSRSRSRSGSFGRGRPRPLSPERIPGRSPMYLDKEPPQAGYIPRGSSRERQIFQEQPPIDREHFGPTRPDFDSSATATIGELDPRHEQ